MTDKMNNEAHSNAIAELTDEGYTDEYDTMIGHQENEKKRILTEVREKFPDCPLFSVTLPYNGTFVIRPQEMSDVKVSSQAVEEFVHKKIDELGGQSELQKLDEQERANKMREIDAEAADISNDIALKRCVIYPYDFVERIESMEPGKGIPAGVVPLLLDKILEISGWQDVQVEEI